MNTAQNQSPPLSYYVLLGAARSSIAFPIEHPFELVKLTAQAHPHIPSIRIARSIFNVEGVRGFTNTALTNFPRRVVRESIRWPVIGYTHQTLIQTFPRIFSRDGANSKIVTAISVGLFESLVILPLEQLMAFRVKERERYTAFYKKRFSKNGIPSLYRSFRINFFRQSSMWLAIIGIDHESKRKFDHLDPKGNHPYLRQAFASTSIAVGIISMILPLDFIKVRIQMEPKLQNKAISTVTKTLLRQHGALGFYAGALPIFCHTLIHATIAGQLFDKIFSSKPKS